MIDALNSDTITMILSFLPYRDVIETVPTVCRDFNVVSRSRIIWEHHAAVARAKLSINAIDTVALNTMLSEAQDAINSLSMASLNELVCLHSPSPGVFPVLLWVKGILENSDTNMKDPAVMNGRKRAPNKYRRVDTTEKNFVQGWGEFRAMIRSLRRDFMRKLAGFRSSTVSPGLMKAWVDELESNEAMDVEYLRMRSTAAASLACWSHGVAKYAKYEKRIKDHNYDEWAIRVAEGFIEKSGQRGLTV
jgi:hypothetical protein